MSTTFPPEVVEMFANGNYALGEVDALDRALDRTLRQPMSATFARRDADGIAVIGPTKHDLMGIRHGEGEVGNTPVAETPPAAAAPAAPATRAPKPATPAAPAPAAPATTAAESTPPWKAEDFDGERAWKKIQAQKADLEAERGKREQAVKDAETAAEKRAAEAAYKAIGKTLGVVSDDETPTVEGLSEALQTKDATLTSTQADLKAARIENAILRHADKFGGDADALTDSESFRAKLSALDSTATDHASQVEALVKVEIEANPRFRKVQVATANSNGETPTGTSTPVGEKSIEQIRKERAARRAN